MQSRQVLHLYRAILKNARFYPSKNRDKLITEAKSLFREHKDLQDRAKLDKELESAKLGLAELQMYAPQNIESADGDMSVTLRGGTLPSGTSADKIK